MVDHVEHGGERSGLQWAGLVVGGGVFAAMLLVGPPAAIPREAWVTAALGALMIVWWITEAIPIPATAMAPLVILPSFGVASLKNAAAHYMSPVVILLLAGFIIAKAIERWNLHERLALLVLRSVGARPSMLIGGFMIAGSMTSMWISNTATALMMTPIALSVAAAITEDKTSWFRTSLLLAVAYSTSIGGLATPVGSPTNLIVIGYLAEQGVTVTFRDWMALGLPVVLAMLPLAWLVLVAFGARGRDGPADPKRVKSLVGARLAALGAPTGPEIRCLAIFLLVACAWVFGEQIRAVPGLSALDDQVIAMIGVFLFFLAPSGAAGQRGLPLLDWRTAEKIPWGVVLLFGGGLSLAGAISSTGLAEIMAGGFMTLTQTPTILLVLALTAFILILTEFTSNVATVSAMMPMIGAIALAGDADLLLLAAPVGLAASCAFMLPMGTGPNAVAYAAGGVSVSRMATVGVGVNVIGVFVITAMVMVMRT